VLKILGVDGFRFRAVKTTGGASHDVVGFGVLMWDNMISAVRTREFRIGDYDAAVELWKRVEGVEIAEGDSRENIAQYILRNRGLSWVATDGPAIIGVALCGHDGRRGHIYHLAIEPAYQRLGLGKVLVDQCLQGLRRAGIKRAIIMVADDNASGRSFWRRCGWEDIPGAVAMGIDL
jgi:ribosomal protein S18 acetylase RimI-like enzyme